MSRTYVTITLNLDDMKPDVVQFHVKHEDGSICWRIDGNHDPIYLSGTPEELRRFAESAMRAADIETPVNAG